MRKNPFVPIYRLVNSGTNVQKYEEVLRQNGNAVPKYLDIELTNMCNYKCRFCPTGTGAMKRMKGIMPEEVVEAVIANVKKYHVGGVRLIRWGEPTMHPDYIEIVRRIKEAGALVHINTNGSLLDESQIQRLLEIHLDSIKFSFQGADEGTYNEMRYGGDYGHLLSIVRRFHELRGDKEYPFIQISTTITHETKEQIQSFKSDIGDYCDYFNIGYTKLNHLDVESMNIETEEKEKIMELQSREAKLKYHPVCVEAFDKLSINWNGDATLCCADYDNYMIVGNIMDEDIIQIFNNKSTKIYREAIAKMQYQKIECCKNCYETVELES